MENPFHFSTVLAPDDAVALNEEALIADTSRAALVRDILHTYHLELLMTALVTTKQHEHQMNASVSDWLRSLITNDADARYYSFSIASFSLATQTSHEPLLDTALRRLLTKCCESASGAVNGRSKANGRRHPTEMAIGAIYVPAVKNAPRDAAVVTVTEDAHIHGWLRVPRTQRRLRKCPIQEHNRSLMVLVPPAVEEFVAAVRKHFHTRNIWFTNDGVRLVDEVSQDFGSIAYLRSLFTNEQRLWNAMTPVPGYLFPRIVGGVR